MPDRYGRPALEEFIGERKGPVEDVVWKGSIIEEHDHDRENPDEIS
jgi:hypothetical protein